MSVATRSYFQTSIGVPVSIAVSKPKDWNGIELPQAKPNWNHVHKFQQDGDWDDYANRYRKTLTARATALSVAVQDVIDSYGTATFCCWCKNPDTCHRSLFADWLEANGWTVDRG